MAIIDSVKLPDNSTYEVADNHSGYQKETLTTPLTINDTQETTVEGALGGLNDYGDALADNLAANEESGAKNSLDDNDCFVIDNMDKSGHIFTNNNTDSRTYFKLSIDACNGTTPVQNLVSESISQTGEYSFNVTISSAFNTIRVIHDGSQRNIGVYFNFSRMGDQIISLRVLGADPTTISGLSFDNVMIRDDRILDPTFAPYAKTNQQLTADKAERADLATLNLTGSTNTTGSTINAGVYFYLNGSYCKAKTSIANGVTFTLNTNYEEVTVGEELNDKVSLSNQIQSNIDLDDLPTGFWRIGGDLTNAPSSEMWGSCISFNVTGGFQIATRYLGEMYIRYENSGWSAWKEIQQS